MEMPCPCNRCGDWFDLNDGRTPPNSREVYCSNCGDILTQIHELEQEKITCQIDYNNDENKRYNKKRIKEIDKEIEELSNN